jgi:uracil permease
MEQRVAGSKRFLLGLQHTLAMFGATVLVPALTGLNPSVALLTAGLGTLLFHFLTKGKVPVFLGSSFAFIGVIKLVGEQQGLPFATGGLIAAGALYFLLAALIMLFGLERIRSFFPPVVVGPMIMVIGLTLSPIAVKMAAAHWGLAAITLGAVLVTAVYGRGLIRILPILVGIAVGLLAAMFMGKVDTKALVEAPWFAVPPVMWPAFSWSAVLIIAPVALVTVVEHIGDVTTSSAVIGKDLVRDPGLHRTLLGDGAATALAGLMGGPANTTYSENTGVLAVTKVYDPAVLRIAAGYAILMAFVGKLGALMQTLPLPVMGGISIVLFGMITSVGIRTVVEAGVDFSNVRNLAISALILVLGIGGASIPITPTLTLEGLALAALVGIVLNKLLPEHLGIESQA